MESKNRQLKVTIHKNLKLDDCFSNICIVKSLQILSSYSFQALLWIKNLIFLSKVYLYDGKSKNLIECNDHSSDHF